MISDISISRSLGNLPEAQVVLHDIDEIQSIMDVGITQYEYTATIDLPNDEGSLEIIGNIHDYSLSFSVDSIALSFSVRQGSSVEGVYAEVHVGVCVATDLISDFEVLYEEDDTLRYAVLNGATAGQIAEGMATQAGVVLQWDSFLDYEVVNLLNPMFLFKGTFLEGIQELLEPFDIAGYKLYEVVVADDGAVSVHRVNSLTTPGIVTTMNIGVDTHIESSPTISKTDAGLPQSLDYWWCEPRDIEEETETIVTTFTSSSSNTVPWLSSEPYMLSMTNSEIIEEVTSIGGFTLFISKDTYTNHFDIWGITEHEETTYTYDPVPDSENIFYRKDFVISNIVKVTEYYSAYWDFTSGSFQLRLWKTVVENKDYVYETDRWGTATTLQSEITGTETTYGEEIGSVFVYQGTSVTKAYKALSESVMQTVITTRAFNEQTNGTFYEETDTETTTQPGVLPAPSAQTINDYLLCVTRDGHVSGVGTGLGDTVTFPFNPETNGVIADLQNRMNKEEVTCQLITRSNYDLQPGSWVTFSGGTDDMMTVINEGVTTAISLEELFDYLPENMLVTTVDVQKSGVDITCSIGMVGWR